ncbi:TIGR01244 family sulfur transferase [Microvirga flavescens]|uniref:TIGR01244 family sulfur transferase n=1 Tax=Microvirga flavescens TaxID=2249811 RepID=UPI000DD88BEC|nr:TIGR01244 family sulfur transferase [Microvirga flavescens]
MQAAKLSQDISVSPQLTEDDLKQAATQGFKSVINNRPDGESPDQPLNTTLAALAAQLGLDYRHIPLVPGQLTAAHVAAFKAALGEMKHPILAFCRSGTRSATLWALASAGQQEPEDILRAAAAAGYNLEHLRSQL